MAIRVSERITIDKKNLLESSLQPAARNFHPPRFPKVAALYLLGALLYAALALAIILSFSDIADIARQGNQFVIDGKVKLYWGALFGPVFLLFTVPAALRLLRRIRDLNALEVSIALWFAGNIIALGVGLAKGNDLKYLLGDTFILSIIPLSYFFTVRNIEAEKDVRRLFYLMLAVPLIFLMFPVTWGVPSQRDGYMTVGFYTFNGSEALVTGTLMVLGIFNKNRWLCIILLVAAISASLLRTRMTYILQVLSIMPVIFLMHYGEKGFLRNFILILSVTAATVVFLVGSGVIPNPPSYERTEYFLRAGYTNTAPRVRELALTLEEAAYKAKEAVRRSLAGGEKAAAVAVAQPGAATGVERPQEVKKVQKEDIRPNVMIEMPASQRIYESGVVVDRFRGSPLSLLLGFGNGATLDLSKTPDVTLRIVYREKINSVHSIHLLPFAILYRQGVLGIALFGLLCSSIITYFIRMKGYFRSPDRNALITEILFLNVFMMLVGSLTAAPHFFINLTVGFSLGLIGVMVRKAESSSTEEAARNA